MYNVGTTYGFQTQNLRLKLPESRRLRLSLLISYFVLDSIVPYLYSKISARVQPYAFLPDSDPKKKWWKRFSKLEDVIKFLNFVNFLIFMYEGKYVTLVNRLLYCKYETIEHVPRNLSFEYLNRQLIWNGFTDFMKFIMPKIDVRTITNYFKFSGRQITDQNCEICGDTTTIPYVDANERCLHTFCYWCIYQKINENKGYNCSRCNFYITTIKHAQIH